jgi:large subunit ribosomal protein L15
MVVKTHKTKKSKGQRGTTNYHGARKKWKSSGHKGGKGMAGTGKRADHKKSLIIKLYGNDYFGKQGITSRGTKKDRRKEMNLRDIETNFDSLMKKHGKGNELDLSEYKILGEGELSKKIIIKAFAFSVGAKEKIEKIGGSAIAKEKSEKKVAIKKEEEKPVKKTGAKKVADKK